VLLAMKLCASLLLRAFSFYPPKLVLGTNYYFFCSTVRVRVPYHEDFSSGRSF
jgi:hypothetical protein